MSEKKLPIVPGDRVLCITDYDGNPTVVKKEGLVIWCNPVGATVFFDDPIEGNGTQYKRQDNCWWVAFEFLKRLTPFTGEGYFYFSEYYVKEEEHYCHNNIILLGKYVDDRKAVEGKVFMSSGCIYCGTKPRAIDNTIQRVRLEDPEDMYYLGKTMREVVMSEEMSIVVKRIVRDEHLFTTPEIGGDLS